MIDLSSFIIDVPNFPKKGIIYKDITPLLMSPSAVSDLSSKLIQLSAKLEFDSIVAIESRGFIIGTLLAQLTHKPLILARKAGKLPRAVSSRRYALEYNDNSTIEIHADDVSAYSRPLIVDDVIATGGTAIAVESILSSLDTFPVGILVLLNLKLNEFGTKLPIYEIIP